WGLVRAIHGADSPAEGRPTGPSRFAVSSSVTRLRAQDEPLMVWSGHQLAGDAQARDPHAQAGAEVGEDEVEQRARYPVAVPAAQVAGIVAQGEEVPVGRLAEVRLDQRAEQAG